MIPFILLANIGIAILYNMGTNILLGQISYITKAISAVLQLGVTMDFAIFLYHSYKAEKKTNKDKNEAMVNAIQKTFTSVVGSSLTTIAGFLALCSMNLTLGKDIGDEIARRRQRRQAGADDVGRFAVHIGGLFGGGKGFIVTGGIVHKSTSCDDKAACLLGSGL